MLPFRAALCCLLTIGFSSLHTLHTASTTKTDKDPTTGVTDCSSPGVFQCSVGNVTNSISEQGVLCIPQAWVCDQDLDCPGGEDEHMDCPVAKCGKDQFECLPDSLVRCIPSHWQCDGRRDCSRGEDEAPGKCWSQTKKGTRHRGSLVDTFQCLPNWFRCPGTRDCIHLDQVCDGHGDCPRDYADEGAHCRNRACRSKECPQNRCKETIQGAVCYCEEGMEFNDTHCVDLDECKQGSFCDQHCLNTVGGHSCSCVDGYVKVHDGECKIPSDETAYLVVANYINVETFDLSEARFRTITRSNVRREPKPPHHQLPGNRVTMLDVNVHNKTVCFLDTQESQPDSHTAKLMFALICVNLQEPSETWKIPIPYSLNAYSSDKKTAQQTDITSFARDWLSGNWYFSDVSREFIFMCAPLGGYCQPVITQGIKKPHSIALDPTRGYLFYSNWSPQAHLGRAALDGTDVTQLAKVKVIHPVALTLDLPRRHIYWADSFLDVVERMDYQGGNRQVVHKGSEVAFAVGLAVLENWLFVANHYNNSIVQVNTRHSNIPAQLTDFKSLRPGTLKVFHSVMQPKGEELDVCERRDPPCDHLCFPMMKSGGGDGADAKLVAVCRCQLGYIMRDQKCHKLFNANESKADTLLLTNGQQGMVHILDPVRATELFPPVTNLVRPSATDCDAENGVVYFYDSATKTLARRGIQGGPENKVEVLREDLKCEGLAFDWVGRNLYCSNSLPGHGAIVAVSLTNPQHQVTVLDSQTTNHSVSPKALLLDANKGILYWVDWSYSANSSLNWLAMDGSAWGTVLSNDRLQWPNGLAFLPATNSSEGPGTLYWTDAFYDVIESVSVDGQDRKTLKEFQSQQHPFGLAIVREKDSTSSDELVRVVWAESIDGHLNQLSLPSREMLTLRSSSAPIFGVKFCSVKTQPPIENHPCSENNGGCSDLCLVTPDQGHICKCADGRETTDGGITCTGELTRPSCHESEFECSNGQCIARYQLCDGYPDCEDSSDEVSDSNPDLCKNETCADKNMFGCHNGLCIYSQFVCDGEADCEHKEDELDCKPKTCPDDHHQCQGSGQCIPASWVCDGQRDCKDGEDEETNSCCPSGVCNTGGCGIDQFMCKMDGRCISYEYRCDNEYDCSDNSDEMDCNVYCDPKREFKCHNLDVCIPRKYVCDGQPHCKDGSDENDCKQIKCGHDEIACPEGKCLKHQLKCDGVKDCFDGSDEYNCHLNTTRAPKTCHWSEFRCDDGSKCISALWQCDADFDCSDRSDEKHCAKKCAYPNFSCKNLPSLCLPPEKLCNAISDCPDHSDEGRLCEYDMCSGNDCEKNCHSSPYGFVCSCPSNQRINPDNKTCSDIDTCETWGVCSQGCSPTAEGHRCYCHSGYVLRPDGYSCRPTDEAPHYLIMANRHDISRFDLITQNHTSLRLGLKNTISVDFHYNKKLLFWSDLIEDKIYSGYITGAGLSGVKPIVERGMMVTEGLAVDWITEHIYWVESSLDHIEVAKFDGTHRATLIAGNIFRPRAITLDPSVGALFWTDLQGEYPRIEKCSMAGEAHTRSVIFDIRNLKGGGWPNGLTTDLEQQRLYWVDASSDSIHTTDYAGQDHKLVLKSHRTLGHPFSITVFEHYVFWTDWDNHTVVRANKFNGSNPTILHETYSQPFDLQVFHPKRQPPMKNPCEGHQCSHLCLIGQGLQPVCQCPHMYKLATDNTTCIKNKVFLLYAKDDEIRGVYMDNANYSVIPSITDPFVKNASSIDYDVLEERLYWTDTHSNVITSAFLNGTDITTVIDSGLFNPSAFAIDWISRNMYFSSHTEREAKLEVAKLDGAYRKQIFKRAKSKLNSIAVDPSKGVMFWSDLDSSRHKIWKAKMDGQSPVVFVQGDKVREPASLTLDLDSDRLYWVSRTDSTVYYCQIVGQCQPQAYSQVPSTEPPVSMTLYHMPTVTKDKVFLFYSKNRKIIKFAHGNQTTLMTGNTTGLHDMKVYNPDSRVNKTNGCSKNKGGCEQLCLPSGETTVCACTVGYQTKDGLKCTGVDLFLLYAQASKIHGVTLDGKTAVLAPISQISRATAVDYHAEQGRIYWVDADRREISCIKRDLSDRKTVVSQSISGAESLAVDWIAGNLYWTDQDHNTIEVSRLDGSQRFVVLYQDISRPTSIVLNPVLGYLYFANGDANAKIIRARLDGSDKQDFVVSSPGRPMKSPYGLAVDNQTGDLYWCDKVLKVIERVSHDGVRETLVDEGLGECVGLFVHGDFLYWAHVVDKKGSIHFMSKTVKDATPQLLMGNILELKDIGIFDSSRQTGSNPCGVNNGGCSELCLYRGQSQTVCACSHGKLMKDGKTCGDYDAFLLYSEVTSLTSVRLDVNHDPNPPRQAIQHAGRMKKVIGLAFDHDTNTIYFSDMDQGNIQSVSFTGSDFRMVVPDSANAEGLAFDRIHGHLYYTSLTTRSINRVKVTDTSPKSEIVIQLGSLDHPRHIVLDPCVRRIFWTNWSGYNPSIQTATYERAALNISGPTIPVTQAESIITEKIKTPNGLAIDHTTQKLYWADAKLDKIERCEFDGSNRFVILSQFPEHPFGMVVYGNFLYWTDWTFRALLRVNKWDGSGLKWIRKNIARQPMSIVAIAEDADDCMLNPCHNNLFGCAEICVIGTDGAAQCKCGEGKRLLSDGKRCVYNSVICRGEDFVCENKRQCIPFSRTCDGFSNCVDASDESLLYCKTRHCPPGLFQCSGPDGIQRCLSESSVCNSQVECPDGADERNCPCGEGQFRCNNGECIDMLRRCDYVSDCLDHSDEMKCNTTCEGAKIEGGDHTVLVPCNTTSMCIYPAWICDGNNDCFDNNDEVNCDYINDNTTCPHGYFKCDKTRCIRQIEKCNNVTDCEDGTDESECECEENTFQCNGSCLPDSWKCDGTFDCLDGSDEGEKCEGHTCTEHQFRCDSGRCIAKAFLCDGDNDCESGEDERVNNLTNCTAVTCWLGEFTCHNQMCIDENYVCDGRDDCGDSSDEPDTCANRTCVPEVEFACVKGNKCVLKSQRCNSRFDCPDHSDEADCPTHWESGMCQNQEDFRCDNGICLSGEELLCNGFDDCGDESDEPSICGMNECDVRPPLCNHVCVDKKIGYECQCHQGYQKTSSGTFCEDINECQVSLPCTHYCHNKPGGYKCSCEEGYQLQRDGHSCIAMDNIEPHLLVINRYYTRLISTRTPDIKFVLSRLNNGVAVDYDWNGQMIYWSELLENRAYIKRMAFNFTEHMKYDSSWQFTSTRDAENAKEIQTLHETTTRNPDGMAVDWIGGNLYWTDRAKYTIEVSKLNGQYRKILLRKGLEEPRAIEVFPQKGLLFYTDWGDRTPHIAKMNMDGTDRKHIINESIAWPNALSIDYITEKIFWGDSQLDYIGMADLDGKNARVIIGDSKKTPHVFAITTFEDTLYWTDWELSSVMAANKFSGHHVRKISGVRHRPMDVQVVHPSRQLPMKDKRGLSPCDYVSCSHLCLLRPGALGQVVAGCACPENHYLAADNRTCVSNCTSSQFLCASGSKCIPSYWYCDKRVDCEDGSDEPSTCGKYYCPEAGMLQCRNASSAYDCFPPSSICDGSPQCRDGSDEFHCESYTCMEHYKKCKNDNKCIPIQDRCPDEPEPPKVCDHPEKFLCNNSQCISYMWVCDGDEDCLDGSDEPENCESLSCREGFFKCKITGQCIKEIWKCDGDDDDCGEGDDSDENNEECHSQTCNPNYFRCNNGHCIPRRWHCDHHSDCRDHSDEKNCDDRPCSQDEFKCSNGKCIPNSLVCNNVFDCQDRSDEDSSLCDVQCDEDTQFKCTKFPKCIPKQWRCDGDTDCQWGSDEHDCDLGCPPNEFQCNNSKCIPSQWQCDGHDDCEDNSDENATFCATYKCPPHKFKCQENKCILNKMVCDGLYDCEKGEDEDPYTCEIMNECNYPNFLCSEPLSCLQPQQLCNRIDDCADGSDENATLCGNLNVTGFNDCRRCEQKCETAENGMSVCACKRYYKLNDDGQTCSLENPCHHFSTCPQHCQFEQDTKKVHCTCGKGFTRIRMDGDHRGACIALGENPELLIPSDNNHVTRQPVYAQHPEQDTFRKRANVSGFIVAIDADVSKGVTFFVNNTGSHHALLKQQLHRSAEEGPSRRRKRAAGVGTVETLHLQNTPMFAIASLAVDWVAQRIYLLDATSSAIHVYNYQARRGKVVVRNLAGTPQRLAVDPLAGYVFWSSTGYESRIERSDLDGSNRVNLPINHLAWPNGITLDTVRRWIYWADTKKKTIEVAKYDGTHHEIVYTFPQTYDPPNALDLMGHFLYVLTHYAHRIVRISKMGDDVISDEKNLSSLVLAYSWSSKDVSVVQPSKQLKVKSNCTRQACHPTQLCFNKPQTDAGFTCVCPDGASLVDGKCDYPQPPSCDTDFCLNEGTCNISMGLPKCSCPPSFHGDRCELQTCGLDFCRNNGKCLSFEEKGKPKFMCSCHPGFVGDHCEISQPTQDWCPTHCKNGGDCQREKSGYITCVCRSGFTGVHCSDCADLHCFNGGTCSRDASGQPRCECPANLDPRTQCSTVLACPSLCQSHAKDIPEGCDCRCPPSYLTKRCTTCRDFCKNGTPCSIKNGQPRCDCGEFYSGLRCEKCNCEPKGSCLNRENGETVCSCRDQTFGKFCEYSCTDVCGPHGHCTECALNLTTRTGTCTPGKCVCRDGYSGELCERSPNVTGTGATSKIKTPEVTGSNSGTASIAIGVCIAVVIMMIIVVLVVVLVIRRRKRRHAQYGHKRMDKRRGGNLNVTNPVYLKRDFDEDDDEEDEELNPFGDAEEGGEGEGRVILPQDSNETNFGSPLFESYTSTSTQRLLDNSHSDTMNGSATSETEKNHNTLDGLKVEYSSPGGNRNGKMRGKKKSQNSRTSVA